MNARRKKTYFLALGLGAAALLVDRVFLARPVSAPESASAEELTQVQNGATAVPAPAAADSTGIPELPFPTQLERYSPAGSIPDLFANPAESIDAPHVAQTDNSDPKKESEVAAARIAQMLQGVFVHADVQYAIVDGRTLKRGENIIGCTLTEISGTRVRFLCADREVIATVPNSSGSGPR